MPANLVFNPILDFNPMIYTTGVFKK